MTPPTVGQDPVWGRLFPIVPVYHGQSNECAGVGLCALSRRFAHTFRRTAER